MSTAPSTPQSTASSSSAARRTPDDVDAADVLKVCRPDGSLHADSAQTINAETILALYRAMVRVRLLDKRLVVLQRQGRIGFHIGAHGEEAAIIGSAYAMRPQDWIFPCYREFGAALLRGMPLQRYVDNMFGNAGDPAKGRQMPDHYFWKPANFTSISSPIGTQITHSVGAAWAAKIKKEDVVTLAYFGEGATSSSDFHNGLNFAGVFKTPSVFLCRNNGWAISVPSERQTASATFAEKGVAYGMPGVRVDGNDLFAVVKATQEAVARAAAGEGPTLIEAMTYRLDGHSTNDDPNVYRRDATLDPWRKLDPIARVRRYLEANAGWTEERESAQEAEIDAEIRAAVAAAEKTPAPAVDSLFDDVFGELPWHLVEQREALRKGPRAKGHGGH